MIWAVCVLESYDIRSVISKQAEELRNNWNKKSNNSWKRDLTFSKVCKYEVFSWRQKPSVTLWVGAQGKNSYKAVISSKMLSLLCCGSSVCVYLCMYVLQWTALPGQALVGMGLASSPGHWLGGWPSLSSCVWVGWLCFVMEMLFPSNPWTWLEGQQLPEPVKREWCWDFNSWSCVHIDAVKCD